VVAGAGIGGEEYPVHLRSNLPGWREIGGRFVAKQAIKIKYFSVISKNFPRRFDRVQEWSLNDFVARKPSPGANLAIIAQSLGLSVSTASRAIRNAEGIHPETRKMVLEKAGEFGYVLPGLQGPDIQARPHQVLALATSFAPGTDEGFLTGMSRTSIAMNLAVLSHHVQPHDCASVLDHERQPVAM